MKTKSFLISAILLISSCARHSPEVQYAKTKMRELKMACPQTFNKETVIRGIIVVYCSYPDTDEFGNEVIVSQGYKICNHEICGEYTNVVPFNEQLKEQRAADIQNRAANKAMIGNIVGGALINNGLRNQKVEHSGTIYVR